MRKQPRENITPAQYVRRFEAEAAAMERGYCDIFGFWRTCPFKRCRKVRGCVGDGNACLKRGVNGVSREAQWRARAQLVALTPASAGPPERTARGCMPLTLFELEEQRRRLAVPAR